MLRGSFACVGATVPKAGAVTFVFGPPNHGVLRRLNASPRTCSRSRPDRLNVLNIEKSTSVGRLVRTSSSRTGRVRRVNAGCTCHATGSLVLAQFWRAPAAVWVQVLNQ